MSEATIELARLALVRGFAKDGAVEWIGATGISMLPAIRSGDDLLVDFRVPRPRLGHVVLFETGGRLVVAAWSGTARAGR